MAKASIWDVVRAELLRLETQGKDDHRDSWMGNAIKAINRLEEHCEKHNAYPEFEEKPTAWMAHDPAYMRNRIAWNERDKSEAGPGLIWEPLHRRSNGDSSG